MISAWMAYAILVGVLSGGAAWVLETLLRAHRWPARWIWAGAMAFGGLWPVWMILRPEAVTPIADPPGVVPFVAFEPLALQVGTTSIWQILDTPLVIVWVLATSGLLALALLLLLRTHRLRKRWTGEEAGGRAILISEDWGPAVVGFINPQIVLPRWCQAIEEGGLDLILDHEVEHLKAGDLHLLFLAGLAPVFLPWSLPLWWMWHRLRLAVEGDCDLRVLRKNPRATRAYLELLLEVGRRLPEGRMAAAMLSEPERTLERRIRIMTMPFPKKPLMRGALLAGVGMILVAVACLAPSPMALDDEAELPAVAVEAPAMSDLAQSFADEPSWTPFTVRPDIRNREEIAQAMERGYPPLLRDAGIGGTVTVWFFIDEEGITRKTQINESSGHPALDDAALGVAEVIEFTPAVNRDKQVPVWISLPITFTVSDGERPARPATPIREMDAVEAPSVSQPAQGVADEPVFTPFTVRPDIKNRNEIARAMEENYPPLLRDAGIGGTVTVWFFIDEEGVTQRTLINDSSGHPALDDAALRVAEAIEFTPALNRDKQVPVWISMPITFTTR